MTPALADLLAKQLRREVVVTSALSSIAQLLNSLRYLPLSKEHAASVFEEIYDTATTALDKATEIGF